MRALRLITWNCHHGSLSARLADLADDADGIAFVQEFVPASDRRLAPQFVTRTIGPRKGIALAALSGQYQLTPLRRRPRAGRAVVAAAVTGPVSFTALGIWARGPKYSDDVMRTLDAYAKVLSSGSAVVMGDLNSGTDLRKPQLSSRGHTRIVDALERFGLVSAYHAFHDVAHGFERHATYRHLFKVSQPWHIDFCFVPASWRAHLIRADVLDGDAWHARSDHLPLAVEFLLPARV